MPYLNEQGVPEYMQDALNQILQIRIRRQMPVTKYPTSPKEPINIAQFLGNYCKSVANGTHLFKREFEFITLTSRNRLQFLRLLEKSFAVGLGDETLGIADFHSLVELLCPDFPEAICHDVYEIIKDEEKTLEKILVHLRFRLLFLEFVDRAKEKFSDPEVTLEKILDDLSVVAGTLRDNFLPSPKIYSLKEHVPNLKTEGASRAWELFAILSKDPKVISLIDSLEFDSV
ncbi:Oidioi.mRNA.OKI2018_I69.PAR.g11446.t1.cds [Oikopleura dioica]|uniref:Centriolar satellite-associated tubulin polyglutamylase complex regulator 1 n=1 Tax=Oikopleura dioica TaxID=34765 RepID=A0ABN7S0E8_OIKDI|nr:Oidioi.mRNA.OKI2018_I69.PAR.g11446.t1.cds [Oikopleura dioica]